MKIAIELMLWLALAALLIISFPAFVISSTIVIVCFIISILVENN